LYQWREGGASDTRGKGTGDVRDWTNSKKVVGEKTLSDFQSHWLEKICETIAVKRGVTSLICDSPRARQIGPMPRHPASLIPKFLNAISYGLSLHPYGA
jgi:hypothetical protein